MKKLKALITGLCAMGLIVSPFMAEATTDSQKNKMSVKPAAKATTTDASDNTITGPEDLPSSGIQYLPIDLSAPGQSFVTSGPYLGTQVQYSGSHLIINSPSVNEDVSLLNLQMNIHERLITLGVPEQRRYHLLLSGVVEGAAMWKHPATGGNSSDISVTNVSLDSYILGNQMVSGLVELSYDDDPGEETNFRSGNSHVFVNKAFIVLGDFSRSNWYGTIGQLYVPFGTYSSSAISSPLTRRMARTKARAIVVGYQQQGKNAFYASTYIFKGDSFTGGTSRIKNGGVNLGYRFSKEGFSGNIGGGAIANLADSVGMQNTENEPLFDGFGGVDGTGNEHLTRRVPAYDVRALLNIGENINLLAEYITAGSSFNSNDLTFNGHGAKPSALNAEASYSFTWLGNKPSSVSLIYGMTREALALGLPSDRYGAAFNTSLWRNTLQTLEVRRDNRYGRNDVSSGSNVTGPSGLGRSDNVVTFQFDVYF